MSDRLKLLGLGSLFVGQLGLLIIGAQRLGEQAPWATAVALLALGLLATAGFGIAALWAAPIHRRLAAIKERSTGTDELVVPIWLDVETLAQVREVSASPVKVKPSLILQADDSGLRLWGVDLDTPTLQQGWGAGAQVESVRVTVNGTRTNGIRVLSSSCSLPIEFMPTKPGGFPAANASKQEASSQIARLRGFAPNSR